MITAPRRPGGHRIRLAAALVTALALPLGLASCQLIGGPDDALHVLAGSEVSDMEPILADLERETGVRVELEFIGSLDGAEALIAGAAEPSWQAAWFPSNRYLSLFEEGQALIADETSIMRSPVVLGVKADVAAEHGWSGEQQPSWQQVVDAVEQGTLRYGMTSPISSNSGFTTLVEAATALSGTGTVLQTDDIEAATGPLTTFAAGQQLASGSSGWLAEKFRENPDAVDGIFNYESVLAGLQQQGVPLQIVIPSDGVVTADYPLTLLPGASDEVREAYDTAVAYLTSPEVQQRIADETFRRTTATPPALDASVFELPFPATLDTVQTLLETWLASVKKPSTMTFVIDTSGSMGQGSRMEDLRTALHTLSGEQQGSAAFLRFQPRERITYLEFAGSVKSRLEVELPADESGYQQAIDEIDARIESYQPDGGTAIYSTLQEALLSAGGSAGDDTITSVVLFSDGENTGGIGYREFETWYRQFAASDPAAAAIPVYAIVFGESDAEELEQLVELTGGRAFDATSDELAAVFKEIRGYL